MPNTRPLRTKVQTNYDMVVIGAGIHGAGVAQAAAARGYKVLVLEKNSVASGTSRKSSKLIHGGLRYLETGQISLVRECLNERGLLLRNAPDLVSLKPFLIPVYKWSNRRPWKIAVGLNLYYLLSGLQSQLRHHKIAKQHWQDLDGLDNKDLQAVFQYYDAQTDDKLLTRSVLQSAQAFDAQLLCHATVNSVQIQASLCEVQYQDKAGNSGSCTASCVVNAAGPWVNEVVRKVSPALPPQAVDLVQGSHIVIDREISQGIYYIESRQDRRAIFVMPWYGKTLLGTTEHLFSDDPDTVHPLDIEIDYLLQAYNAYFSALQPVVKDNIVTAFAGLRVLPRSAESEFKRPRETYLITNALKPARFLSIYGGKLTAYRATAEKVMAKLSPALVPARRKGDTRQIKLYIPQRTNESD